MSKYALISGASRGIGYQTALILAKEGYNIVATCKSNFESLKKLKIEIESIDKECHIYLCDASSSDDVLHLFNNIKELNIEIDVLINNAGISFFGLLQDMSDEDWNEIISTNLSSVFFTCRSCIPMMLKNGKGKIINISSVWGNCGASYEVAYSTTKGGVNSFTKSLAKELGPSNIQVNAIACGIIDTDMNNSLCSEEIEKILEDIPTGRMGTSQEVAEFILTIIKSGNYLTGQVVNFDGGWI